MKIQSVSDIITNSSSEVFIVQTDLTREELLKYMESWKFPDDKYYEEEGFSGMGGHLDICDNETIHEYGNEPSYPYLPKGYLAVDIDWAKKCTIKRMFEEFNVVDAEYDLVIDKNTKKAKRAARRDEKLADDEEIRLQGQGITDKAALKYYQQQYDELYPTIVHIHNKKNREKSLRLLEYYEAEIKYYKKVTNS